MKGSLVAAAAAALVGGATASKMQHRHAHEIFHHQRGLETAVYCSTIWTTMTGPPIWVPTPGPSSTNTPPPPTTTSAAVSTEAPVTVPTPIAHTCPTPGTYTFPATTVVVTETATICGASTTTLSSGTHTVGGVTTIVKTSTVVTCPYATTTTAPNGVITSVILETTYYCPEAGTYTIGPVTTTVTESVTQVVVPVVQTLPPGTYTAPAVVTTIVETDTVIYCPFDTPTPAPVAPTTVAVTTAAAQTSAAASASASTSPSQSSSSAELGGTGGKWSMAYTPYDSTTGACKDSSSVYADIQKIKNAGFRTVRVYSTDCSTLPNVGAACSSLGMKMVIGIFVGEAGCQNSSPDIGDQISAIKDWAAWDLVELIVVANEALNDGFCTIEELVGLINESKAAFNGAGYTGPYGTTDVVAAWQQPGMEAICEVVDVPCGNIHAYFNAATTPSEAGPFVQSQLEIIKNICNTDTAYVVESGWPTKGECNGVACPGVSEQATALASIKDLMGDVVSFFTWDNDLWKDAGSCGCEQSWGSLSAF